MSDAERASAPAGQRLHPASLFTRWLKVIPQMLGGGAAYAFAAQGGRDLLMIVGLAAIFGFVVTLIGWWRFRYTVGAGEIVIESGFFQRRRRVIPFDRVHDVAIERRPIARLLGTAAVRIETGGAASDEGLLDMISFGEAERLRDRIRRGASDHQVAEPDEPMIFAMTVGRVLLAGLFGFSLVFLAIIFAALENLSQIGLIDFRDLAEAGLTNSKDAAGPSLREAGLLSLVVIPVLIAAGLTAGVARSLLRDFGFRLTLAEIRSDGPPRPGLRRRRGLFTLSEAVIPVHRIQSAVIGSGLISRRFGWHRLSFQTLGADTKKQSLQVAAPFATREEIDRILATVGLPSPPPLESFVRVPRRALWRWAGQYLPFAAAAALLAWLVEPVAGVAGAVLIILAIYGVLSWRRHGHAIDEHALFVKKGLLTRRVWTLPFGKLQTLLRSQGPLQRRLRLETLLVDTAGAPALNAPDIIDLDETASQELSARLLARFRTARRDARLRATGGRAPPIT